MRTLLLTLTLAAAAPAAAQQPYFPPPGEWERASPAELGFDSTALAAAVRFAIDNESSGLRDLAANHERSFAREPYGAAIGEFAPRGDPSGLVIRHGRIAAEWGDTRAVEMTFSVTKSFLSTVVGLAVDSGLIGSVHDTVFTDVPIDTLFGSAHNRRITWDHLLRQTSDWEGTLFDKPEWADRPSRDTATWRTRPRVDPGSVYEYNDVRVNALALAALHVWRRPLPEVLEQRVLDPIGASDTWRWRGYRNSWVDIEGRRIESVSGGGHWGGGMFISARDLARFGLFTLHRGVWAGRRLLSDEWFRMALTPTSAEPGYGFMNFFLNTGRRRLPAAPATAFVHLGSGTNAVYVDPEHDLVVVARWIEGRALDDFIARVLDALE